MKQRKYFFTLYLEITILEKYIEACLTSVIEFFYFRGKIAKYIGDDLNETSFDHFFFVCYFGEKYVRGSSERIALFKYA